MSKHFHATIRFLLTSENGRSKPAMSGIRPHIKLGDIFTSCIVRSLNSDETFELGRDYDVEIEIIFWEEYGSLFHENIPIELYDGNRVIATGAFHASSF
jgi:hypothetical protein